MKQIILILIILNLLSCDRYPVVSKVGTIEEIKYDRAKYFQDSLVLNNISGILSYGFFHHLNYSDSAHFYVTFEYFKTPKQYKKPYIMKNGILLDSCQVIINNKKYSLEHFEANDNSIYYKINLPNEELLNNNKFTFIYNNKEIECNYLNKITNFSSLDTMFAYSKLLKWDKIPEYENEYYVKYDYYLRYTKDNKNYSLNDILDKFVSNNQIELLENMNFSEFKDIIQLKPNHLNFNLFSSKYYIYSKYESIFINNTNNVYFYYPHK